MLIEEVDQISNIQSIIISAAISITRAAIARGRTNVERPFDHGKDGAAHPGAGGRGGVGIVHIEEIGNIGPIVGVVS